ncbi:hypothetical protein [Acidianus brierleyi]|uniref:Uncharacterized protein n=1 Tax=Acidianus brierleyi TaxID=41673 RepID=A0A2U9IC24_9CREN|nr:hypothetical protein [Acidianus brierleyi]AWR93562.1 hypothetical protein DFR85_01985 [Acidianus brierleyi]
MHTLLKIGIIIAIVGLVLVFVLSPLLAYQQANYISSQIIKNSHEVALNPGESTNIYFNGKNNNSMFVLIYNTSSYLPLRVSGLPSNVSESNIENHTYIYYIRPLEGTMQITNNQTTSQNLYYSYGYISALDITLIELASILGLVTIFVGIAVGVIGFIRGRKKT